MEEIPAWQSTLSLLRRMMRAREELVTNLEQLDRDIQQKIDDLARQGGDLISGDEEMDIIIALSHYDLTLGEIHEFMGMENEAVETLLEGLMEKGVVQKKGPRYMLAGMDAAE